MVDVNVNVNYSLPDGARLSAFEFMDPAFADRGRASFDRQKIMTLIGTELLRREPRECETHLLFKAEISQQLGYCDGGIIGTIAERQVDTRRSPW